jgi:hypothetical protein
VSEVKYTRKGRDQLEFGKRQKDRKKERKKERERGGEEGVEPDEGREGGI